LEGLSQLKVRATGSGDVRGGLAGTLFRVPTASEGPEKGQARNQLETQRGKRVF